jgi:PEP-CTERM motif
MKRTFTSLLATAAFLSIAAPGQAATYANTSEGISKTFGFPDTTSYGQVFTSPGGSLQSWSFFNTDRNTDGAKFVVANWDGLRATGPALFETMVQSKITTGGYYEHKFSGINLALNTGKDYVAYLTVAGVMNPSVGISFSSSKSSPLGGLWVFLNSKGVDPLSINDEWYQDKGFFFLQNLQYSADFNNSVPEPASWALMIAGFALVGGAIRRRQHGAAAWTRTC